MQVRYVLIILAAMGALILLPATTALAVTPIELNETANIFTVINNNNYDATYYINSRTLEVEPEKATLQKGSYRQFRIIDGETETFTIDEKIGNAINSIEVTYTRKNAKKWPFYTSIFLITLAIIFINQSYLRRKDGRLQEDRREMAKTVGRKEYFQGKGDQKQEEVLLP